VGSRWGVNLWLRGKMERSCVDGALGGRENASGYSIFMVESLLLLFAQEIAVESNGS
jgi:hypothetical protein